MLCALCVASAARLGTGTGRLSTTGRTLGLAATASGSRARRSGFAQMSVFSDGGMLRSLVDGLTGAGGASVLRAVDDTAPSWEDLSELLAAASTEEERGFRERLASGRGDEASALAPLRLFDAASKEDVRVTLYRDTAAWCPYCEKVWLALEEKRVPYAVEKVNMNCYGEKPGWFWAMQPSGGIPVARIDGKVITESNAILFAIERQFTGIPLLPAEGAPGHERVQPLLSLEREIFSSWFRWLTSSMNQGGQQKNFEALMTKVNHELGVSGGPFFLGERLSLVDCMFAPFLERMAASVLYYKGIPIRRNPKWPHVEQWFLAMEARPSYRHIQSDFYTHVHDLPPQVGRCHSMPGAAKYADEIDGADGSWTLPLQDDDGTLLQPLSGLGFSAEQAARQAAERIIANRVNVVRFAARGAGRTGFPPVSAALSDPNAVPDEAAIPQVDIALRHVVHSLLVGDEVAGKSFTTGLDSAVAVKTLGYLRDRISVPRDMGYPAARTLRAHLNWAIEKAGAA
ncbi:hypothetical protein AB1Y20_012529 [Prymnesium parvum]|uniref:GST N-terminal domain-containing protein n=1 Tax=Prymnesium parvum TaxID=97485 RepID=A0AB34IIS0_PRYPA